MYLEYEVVRDVDDVCECSVKHIPNPLNLCKIAVQGEEVFLCPSGVFNLEDLLRQWHLTGGKPAGSITKHYGKYIRDLAETIYKE